MQRIKQSIWLSCCIAMLFLCTYNAQAQVPGYMGKHFLIEYNAAVFPALDLFDNGKVGKFNFRNNFDAEYVTSLGGSVGVTYKTMSDVSSMPHVDTIYYPNNGHMYIHATGMGIFYKNYHHKHGGCIAPLGYYDKFSLIRYSITANGTLYSNSNYFDNYTTYHLGYNLKNYHAMAFSYEYGKHTIFLNRFIFNASAELGLLANGFDLGANTVYLKGQLGNAVASRMFSNLLFNINVGAGILLF